MNKYYVYVTREVYEVWEIEAENETEARINYDLYGQVKSEKVYVSDIEVEEE